MKLQINDDDKFQYGEKTYSLIGSTVHYGSEYFHLGHYIALVKDNYKWYECNDSHVHEIPSRKETTYIPGLYYGSAKPFSRYSNDYTPTMLVYSQDQNKT